MPHPDADRIRALAKAHLWGAFAKDPSSYDATASILARAQGCWVEDIHGNRYLDSLAGNTAITLGYSHPVVVEAMARQLPALSQNATYVPASVNQVLLAEKIASLSPGDLTYTIFSNNGTDANETAIKIARQYWKNQGQPGKFKIIGRDRAFHGSSISVLAAGGFIPRRKQMEPLPPGFAHIATPYYYRSKYPGAVAEASARYADELRQAIEFEDPATVAACLIEQTANSAGVLPPHPDYVRAIRSICDEFGVLMIVDEVVTGFGRTGTWLECLQYGIVPDIVTLAKGITGGHAPLAATHVRKPIAEAFFGSPDRHFNHGYTFGGMAVSCAAALATIAFIEETHLLDTVTRRGAQVTARLQALQQRSPVAGDVRSHGLWAGIELVQDKRTKANWSDPQRTQIAQQVLALGKERGVLLAPFNQYGSLFIALAPPFVISDSELDQLLTAIEAALAAVAQRWA